MRKKAARSAAVVLAAAMTVGILAGCGSKGQGNEETSNRTEDGTGFKDYSEGFPEEVTIQIPVYDRAYEGWDPTDNSYTNWVQTEFGDKYNINVEYVAIGRTTEVQDYMQPESVNHLGEIFSENLKILCLWRYVFLQCFHPIVKKYLESYNPKTLAVIRFLAHFHLLGSRIQV